MGMEYIPKVGKVIVITLTLADTWYPILTEDQTKAIRGFKVKSRQTFNAAGGITFSSKPFDIAFNSSPDASDSTGNGYLSYPGGGGFGDTFSPSNGTWARSPVAGCILEIITYN